jgi:hypothetical protein
VYIVGHKDGLALSVDSARTIWEYLRGFAQIWALYTKRTSEVSGNEEGGVRRKGTKEVSKLHPD